MSTAIVMGIWAARASDAGGWGRAFHSPAALGAITVSLLCFAVQSSVEEIVFRGWMLSAIAAKRSVALAVVLTSLVFTLLHYDLHQPPLFTANVFLFSLFACLCDLETCNVWRVMGWHAAWLAPR